MVFFTSIRRKMLPKTILSVLLAVLLVSGTLPSVSATGTASFNPWTVNSNTNIYFMGAAYGNGTFVTVGDGNPPRIMTSTDGVTWARRSTGIKAPNYFTAVDYLNGMFVVVGNNGIILTSPNGTTWTQRNFDNTANKQDLAGVAYGNGIYVATGSFGTVWTSADGIAWTKTTLSNTSANLGEVTYGNGIFVATGSDVFNSMVLTSTDGINWTKGCTASGSTFFSGVSFINGVFVLVGSQGTIMTSADGLTWTPKTSGTTANLIDAAYGWGTYMIAGRGGKILTSTDMETWTPQSTGTTETLYALAYGNYTFCAAGEEVILSTNLRPTVTGVSPGCGPTAGGTEVTITGSNLSAADAVYFGSTQAASFHADSDTSITAVAPPGTEAVHITVHSVTGTSAAGYNDRFTYADAPSVTGIRPTGQSVAAGRSATFTVTAAGTAPFEYQWFKDGSPLSDDARIGGALSAALTITDAQLSDAGSYTCTVTNAAGYADSGTAALTVNTPVSPAGITGVTPPERGTAPVTAVGETGQYTGTVTWSPADTPFAASTVYTAVISLTPKAGYTFEGVAADCFTVAGAASAHNDADSGVITAVFPATAPLPPLTGIQLQTAPAKVNYRAGQSLDLTGATLKLTYSDNTYAVIPVQDSMVTGFDTAKAGVQTLTVTYLGQTTSFTVNVIPDIVHNEQQTVSANLSEISLPGGVTSVTLDGETLPTSGAGSGSYTAVRDLIGAGNLQGLVLYDLKLLDQNGSPIENFTGKIKVKINIPEGMSGDLHVYWYNPDTNTLTDMNAVVEGNFLVFETTHFSDYVISQLAAKGDGGQSSPDTGDHGAEHLWWVLDTLFVSGAAAYGIGRRRFGLKSKADSEEA